MEDQKSCPLYGAYERSGSVFEYTKCDSGCQWYDDEKGDCRLITGIDVLRQTISEGAEMIANAIICGDKHM